jgi:hypothetical protein
VTAERLCPTAGIPHVPHRDGAVATSARQHSPIGAECQTENESGIGLEDVGRSTRAVQFPELDGAVEAPGGEPAAIGAEGK